LQRDGILAFSCISISKNTESLLVGA